MTMVTSAVAAPATAATPRGGPKHASADFTSALQGAVHELSASDASQAAGGTTAPATAAEAVAAAAGQRRPADEQAGQAWLADQAAALSVPAALTRDGAHSVVLGATVPAPADSTTPGPTDSASDGPTGSALSARRGGCRRRCRSSRPLSVSLDPTIELRRLPQRPYRRPNGKRPRNRSGRNNAGGGSRRPDASGLPPCRR